ncbi:MAG TPA: hypothetical protein VMU29_12935 [Smithella sp.]|nr:hypothetical protein [Smithella sp.]
MREKEYKKLPGRGPKHISFFDVSRIWVKLWLGKDHLLCIYYTGATEDYKRFYYEDIQAIMIRKTIRFLVWNIVFFFLLLVCAILGYKFKFMALPCYVAALFIIIFFLINLAMGPTCVCHLYTMVSEEELYSLRRLSTAKKVIDIITPLIQEKQLFGIGEEAEVPKDKL